MNFGEFWGFSDLFKKRGDLRGDPTWQNAVWVVIFAVSLDGFATAHRPSAGMRFKLTRDCLIAEPKWLIVNNCERHDSEIYNIEDMTKSPSPKKLTPFHIRSKDLKKDM